MYLHHRNTKDRGQHLKGRGLLQPFILGLLLETFFMVQEEMMTSKQGNYGLYTVTEAYTAD